MDYLDLDLKLHQRISSFRLKHLFSSAFLIADYMAYVP
jgi:hypothetical protein